MSFQIGWIGCGNHAMQMLLPQLGRNGARLAAVCDIDDGAAAKAASQYGVSDVYRDYRDLIAHPGLDAVGMAVGPEFHEAAGREALERGLPVFLEKPPARSRSGAEKIAEAAEKTGKPAVVGFMKRYSTGNRIARNILHAPEFGPVLGIMATYTTAPAYFAGQADSSGFFLHHCIHYMDLIPWLVGADFTEMAVNTIEHKPGRLLLHLGFSCETGAIGTLIMGTVQSRGTPLEFIQVMGDHARVEVNNVINVSYFRDPPFKADDPDANLADHLDTLSWTPNFTAAANEDHKGYNAMIGDAVAKLKGEGGKAPTIVDGVRAMGHLEALSDLVRSA